MSADVNIRPAETLSTHRRKRFVLDTGILLANPYALTAFEENDLYIAYETVCELSTNRKNGGETTASAREALRLIADTLGRGGVLPGGGTLRVLPARDYANGIGELPAVKLTSALRQKDTGAVLVSNNNATKICARAHGIPVEPLLHEQVAPPLEQYRGRREVYAAAELIDELYRDHAVDITNDAFGEPLVEHEYLLIHNSSEPEKTALAVYRGGQLRTLNQQMPFGVKPRKVGQKFAIDALLNPDIALVILKGGAGTAKTYLSLAAGLAQVLDDHIYDRILVTRPNVKFDNDIGFLKGGEEEKIGPLMRPVMDNLELLCRTGEKGTKDGCPTGSYAEEMFTRGVVQAQAMAYMRGRSIANTYVIVDEAQNCSPAQIFGIISRIGEGSKIVLAGDPGQIDNPELDSRNNGLSYASEKMRGSAICAQVAFEASECVRSPLALEAIQRMSNRPDGI